MRHTGPLIETEALPGPALTRVNRSISPQLARQQIIGAALRCGQVRARQIIQGTANLSLQGADHVQINLRRADAGMAERLLHTADVHALHQQMRGEAVP